MRLTKPSYFDGFRCVASACPDSCCHQWAVQVDEQTEEFYRDLPGELGDRLREALTEEDGDTILRLEDGRCAMWRQDGLCEIQARLGEQALCRVCREFPRIRQDYGDVVELGLEMSCPEAARIMLSTPDWHLETAEVPGGDEPDYDVDAMALLRSTRPGCLEILADPGYSIGEALAILLLYGYAVQEALDGGEMAAFDPRKALETARRLAGEANPEGLLAFFRGLEILTEDWRRLLDEPGREDEWFGEIRLLAQYGVYRYYAQAVSDYDLAGRIKLVIVSCMMAKRLGGGTRETRLRAIQLYSKEIENDAGNVDSLLDAAYQEPAFADRAILGFLLK